MPGPDEKELSALERSLARLAPSSAGFDRDRLMFESGRAAAHRAGRVWRAGTGLLGLVAASLAAVLLLRADSAPVVRIVTVDRSAPSVAPAPPETAPGPWAEPPTEDSAMPAVPASVGQLHDILVRHGVEGLPDPAPAGQALPERGGLPPVLSAWQWHSQPSASWFNEGVE